MPAGEQSAPTQSGRQIRLDRIMEVLELTAGNREGILLTDVIAGLGIPSSTAYRILGEMRRVGMLEAENGRGRHRLTERFRSLGTMADTNEKVFAEIEPDCASLADELGETIFLVQIRGRIISLVGYVHPSACYGLHPGNAFPIHASASGKILWSYQPDFLIEEELKRPHTKFQEKTLVAPDAIRAALREAKNQGYGVHDEEWDQDVYTMAMPVFAGRRIPTFAVGIMAMKTRLFSRHDLGTIVERLRELRDVAEKMLLL